MAKVKSNSSPIASRPALSPEARENQLIALAENLAEQQLRDGTASSQVISHYLKRGSAKDRLEAKKLEHEIKMLEAKTEQIKSQENIERMYAEAIAAFRDYNGQGGDSYDDEYEDEYEY